MKHILFILSCMHAGYILAQDGFSIQAYPQLGTFVSHKHLIDKPATLQQAFSIDINKKTNGSKYWQAVHGYPQMGVSITYRQFNGNPNLGNAFIAIPYLEFNVLKSKLGALEIKHGTGLAFVTKKYDAVKNPGNTLLSTHLNAASLIDAGYHFNTSKKWDVKAGIAISHISNGNFMVPNAGINTMLAYAGVVYFLGNKNVALKPGINDTVAPKRIRYRIGVAAGLYNYNRSLKKVQVNEQVHAAIFYQHNTRFRTGAGIEASNLRGQIQPALYVEEEVLFAHIATRYGLGIYLLNADKTTSRLYEKVGIAYYPFSLQNHLVKGFSIGANIKAHSFAAAHIELVAAYIF